MGSVMNSLVDDFLAECRSTMSEYVSPADIVLELSPLMLRLLPVVGEALTDEHRREGEKKYARNPVYTCPEGSLSLFAMVWNPGQWTPVHDHGTWGVVGVVEGVLEERNFIRTDNQERDDSGVVLRRGGMSLLSQGTVTTFVPNPDHIHRTGVSKDRTRTLTLHLYGRHMSNYNVYDLELGRRYPMDLSPETQAVPPGV